MRIAFRALRVSVPFAAAAVALLTGCAASVVVQSPSDFPTPLVEPLPVSMGVIIGPELYNFVYQEDLPEQASWTIALGVANVAMLTPVLESMFEETRTVTAVPVDAGVGAQLDGVLRPTLEKFEFDVPVGERDEFVEVWMEYLLTLYEPDGSVVTAWPVSGYGKAELTRKREEAVNRAAVVALREVGAAISTEFAQQPDVSYWLQETQNEAALSAETRLGP